jgi:RNA polymerase sigma-70 factor (ECF subfamily)
MDMSDRTAVAGARDGDGDAFRSLVERYSRYVFAVAYRITGSRSDAEDVVQETFLKAYRQLRRFEARSDFRTWLHRITVNAAIDLIRSRRALEVGEEPSSLESRAPDRPGQAMAGPDRLFFSIEIRERVASAMATLTRAERAAFVLRHIEGLPVRDVATALGLKTEAAKNSIFRAVRKMRASLEEIVEHPSDVAAAGRERPCT